MCHVWHMMTYFNARGGIIHYITSIIYLRSGPRELPPTVPLEHVAVVPPEKKGPAREFQRTGSSSNYLQY